MEKQFLLDLNNDKIEKFNDLKNGIEVLYIIRNINFNINNILDRNFVMFEGFIDGNNIFETFIKHPYLSKNFEIEYINENEFMKTATENEKNIKIKLKEKGFNKVHITSTVYEKDGKIISSGTNSEFHLENGCVRKELGCKTGEGYELCEGCQSINHSEQTAIKMAKKIGKIDELNGANAYLYGHYRSCEPCSTAMENVGIKKLYLSKEFTKKFLNIKDFKNKESLL